MILALDLARQTGWACGEPCAQPLHGTITLDGTSEALRFLQLSRRISDLVRATGATEVVFERPFIGGRFSRSALLPLFGYRAITMASARALGIEPTSTEPKVWRKHFLGHGGGKRAEAKAATLEQCRWRGWAPANEDEADALGLWDWRCACVSTDHLVMGMKRGNYARAPGVTALQAEGGGKDRP